MTLSPPAGHRLGPYETWVYGHGRPYDLPALLLAEAGVLSVIAEIARRALDRFPEGWLGAGAAPRYLVPASSAAPGLWLAMCRS